MKTITNKRDGSIAKDASIEALTRSAGFQEFRAAFRRATGLSLELVQPVAEHAGAIGKAPMCPFSALMGADGEGCKLCASGNGNGHGNGSHRAGRNGNGTPREIRCRAGLVTLAAPVMVAGRHEATLVAGPMFDRKQTLRDKQLLCEKMAAWGASAKLSDVEAACAQAPVFARAHIEAWLSLLKFHADHLGEMASRWIVGRTVGEHPSITKAKEFLPSKNGGRVSLKEIADYVHLNKHYFCRLFKQTTGITFIEYSLRIRIEKAKEMLLKPGVRVGEAAYATGFESAANFNHMFKRYTGMSPSEYKAQQRSEEAEAVPVRRNGKAHSPLNGHPKLAKRWQRAARNNPKLITV